MAIPARQPAPLRIQREKGGREMQRLLRLTALALLGGLGLALSAGAASSQEFKAQFQDDDCATHAQCGMGLVEGYGHVTTTLDVTGGVFDPSTGCLTDVTAVRDIALMSDRQAR